MGCVRLVVPAGEVDEASGRLWLHEPLAVAETRRGDGSVELLAGYDDAATAAMVADVLPGRWKPAVVPMPDESTWREVWRAGAEPVVEAGLRVWPGWWEPPGDVFTGITALIDPASTFGSGSHPTTRLCLRALETLVAPGVHVLDVGCGSGVLAVVALLLGADRARAVDIDPDAVAATRANAEANGVAASIDVDAAGVEAVEGRFDVVVANIGAAVLRDLAPALAERTAVDGRVVVSGLLTDQVEDTIAELVRHGLAVVRIDELDGWAAVVLRPSPS